MENWDDFHLRGDTFPFLNTALKGNINDWIKVLNYFLVYKATRLLNLTGENNAGRQIYDIKAAWFSRYLHHPPLPLCTLFLPSPPSPSSPLTLRPWNLLPGLSCSSGVTARKTRREGERQEKERRRGGGGSSGHTMEGGAAFCYKGPRVPAPPLPPLSFYGKITSRERSELTVCVCVCVSKSRRAVYIYTIN